MFDWLTDVTGSLSYGMIALWMLLENIVPPIPSEVVMPAAGFAVRNGELTFLGVVLAGTIGSVVGAIPWYLAGRWCRQDALYRWFDRHGRKIAVKRSEIERGIEWFDRRGEWTVLVGRAVPGARTLISLPAGLARMPAGRFFLYTAIGSAAWNALLAWLGWLWRDQYRTIGDAVGWIALSVVAAAVCWWLVRLVRRWRDAATA